MSEEASLQSPGPAIEAVRPSAVGLEQRVRTRLGARAIVLVGLMGVGKSTVGRRLAGRLGLHFRDADHEIEAAAGMSIPDIFTIYGEPAFRTGERRVIARLIGEAPMVLATGGGAFMDPETREAVARQGISVWLRADLPILMRRVRKRTNRPLLRDPDPEGVMRRLMEAREPVYATADVAVTSHDGSHDRVVDAVLAALDAWFDTRPDPS
jgi:shikimate kinase